MRDLRTPKWLLLGLLSTASVATPMAGPVWAQTNDTGTSATRATDTGTGTATGAGAGGGTTTGARTDDYDDDDDDDDNGDWGWLGLLGLLGLAGLAKGRRHDRVTPVTGDVHRT